MMMSQTYDIDSLTTDLGNETMPFMTPLCALYHVTMYGVLIGLICVFGLVGNIVAFVVFCADKVKTSTSFLFQGKKENDTNLMLPVLEKSIL